MKKVILDVDTGIDDALAIGYAIRSKKLELLGITTCFGNVRVNDATRNTNFIIHLFNEDIPIYAGAEGPISGKDLDLDVAQRVHGVDGLGNRLRNLQQTNRMIEKKDAATFIIDSIKQYPKEITLIFVGPLTNLATVVKKAPEVMNLVKEVVIMGGAITVPGNVRAHAEANIYSDPEAARFVFQSGLPITLVGLDVTMKTLLPRKYVHEWENSNSEIAQFYASITNHYINAYEEFQPGIGGCGLHDPLAVGVVIDPTLVNTRRMSVEVDVTGDTIGRTYEVNSNNSKMNVCLEVESERFLEHFLSTLHFSSSG